jgi:electron transfer flavoprotein alpha subunit
MILVVAEQNRGKLHRASWEAVAAAQELAGDQPVEALVLGASPAEAAAELSHAAVAAVHAITSALLEPYTRTGMWTRSRRRLPS